MAVSRKKILGICREVLHRRFDDHDGKPIDFDKLPKATRETIIAAAEEFRTPLGVRHAIDEAFRKLREDDAEGLRGPHG